ncbi:efflux RND transporter periplasmic adaptor subunit [Oceanisphaera sp.]|uniref:efflux RND transporter periplasmic adaptor subunit n=1 Tax=Oceanisphaera sp. TaxID=1929979 RepID=UPI003A93D7A5
MTTNRASLWLTRHKKWGGILLIFLVLLFWLWRGELYVAQDADSTAPVAEQSSIPAAGQSEQADSFYVEVRQFHAEPYQGRVLLQGQLLPAHSLTLRAQVNGTLLTRPALGQQVVADELLVTLSDDGRQANLAQAKADLALRQAEVKGAARLLRNQLVSETHYLSLKAAAAASEAALVAARLALAHTQIKAPFAGSIDALPVEAGSFVQAGDPLLTLVDVSALKLSATVPQQQVADLTVGLPVTAVLLDGRTLSGRLSFIARAADERTRSYALEARLDNPDGWRVAGASVGLHINLPAQQAYRVSPALLALDEHGRLGVHLVDEQNRMQRVAVKLLSITPDEAWISGLPDSARIITRGAGFVNEGEPVNIRLQEPAL